MAPTAPMLAQSESKARLFHRLGLSEGDKMHRYLYGLMKAEAVEGWTRISESRDALLPQYKNDEKIEPPYSFGQIEEAAIHREIKRIYFEARPETKIIYHLGQDDKGEREQNWIIRWLLWHVFRYRDERNSSSARQNSLPVTRNPEVELVSPTPIVLAAGVMPQSLPTLQQSVPTVWSTTTSPPRYWDPVRDAFRDV